MLRCGGLVYCLVGAWLEVSILWGISISGGPCVEAAGCHGGSGNPKGLR